MRPFGQVTAATKLAMIELELILERNLRLGGQQVGGSSRKIYYSDTRSVGGSGASAAGGGGGKAGSADPCNITSMGTLRSPVPAVVAVLSVGTVLDVAVVNVGGVDVLEARHNPLGRAGAIDCPEEQAIIECIAAGHRYQATVHRQHGGVVAVQVRRVP